MEKQGKRFIGSANNLSTKQRLVSKSLIALVLICFFFTNCKKEALLPTPGTEQTGGNTNQSTSQSGQLGGG